MAQQLKPEMTVTEGGTHRN